MAKIIFIDVDDTILDFHACAERAIRMGFDEVGVSCDDFAETYHRINDGLWRDLERGIITREQLYARRFVLVFDALGIESDGVEFERIFRRNLALTGDKMEGADELMKYLSEKYDVYVTSNAPQAQQVSRLTISGLLPYVKDVFTSELLDVQKPEIEFFDKCIGRVGNAKKEDIVLIGDSLSADIKGAANAGLQSIWVNVRGAAIPADFAGNHVVGHLLEIKKIL